MARGLMDDAEFEASCPRCGRQVKLTIGDGRRSRSVRCPGGHTIQLEGSGLDQKVRDVERQVESTFRKLK